MLATCSQNSGCHVSAEPRSKAGTRSTHAEIPARLSSSGPRLMSQLGVSDRLKLMSQLGALDRRNDFPMGAQVESGYVGERRSLLNRDQVAACLGASVSTVIRLERRGVLPHVKLGRLVRFRPVDVEALIERAHARRPINDARPADEPGAVTNSAGLGRHEQG